MVLVKVRVKFELKGFGKVITLSKTSISDFIPSSHSPRTAPFLSNSSTALIATHIVLPWKQTDILGCPRLLLEHRISSVDTMTEPLAMHPFASATVTVYSVS